MSVSYTSIGLWKVLNQGRPYIPFDWQAEHIHSRPDVRFIIGACGRRSGKTMSMTAEVVREAFRPSVEIFGQTHNPLVYIAGPTAELSMRIWQPIWDLFVPDDRRERMPPLYDFYSNHDKTRRVIWLKTGGVIQGKSADDPKSLQGDRVTALFTDESHDFPEEAWQYALPALTDSKGRLRAIGIPKGKNRFRSMWERGQAADDPDYYSFSVPSTANPLVFWTDAEAEEAKLRGGDFEHAVSLEQDPTYQSLTDIEREQQYHAKWVESDGLVFRNADAVFTGDWEGPHEERTYIMGLDVAKTSDFTVAYMGDVGRAQIVARDRFNGVDYTVAVPRIANMYHSFGARFIHMDTTGIGEVVADMLRAEGCSIVPFIFSNNTKAALVNTLAREVERGQVILPRGDMDLRKEMELFEAHLSPGGVVKYEAPPGYFDDCVMAAALCVQKMVKNKGMARHMKTNHYVSWTGRQGDSYIPPLPPVKEAV